MIRIAYVINYIVKNGPSSVVLNIINKVCGGVIIFYGCKLIWNFVQLMGWVK